jgi:hypothetical protein
MSGFTTLAGVSLKLAFILLFGKIGKGQQFIDYINVPKVA